MWHSPHTDFVADCGAVELRLAVPGALVDVPCIWGALGARGALLAAWGTRNVQDGTPDQIGPVP